MSKSIHETKRGYWREAAFDDSDLGQRTAYCEKLAQKKFHKANEKSCRQSEKVGTPIYMEKYIPRDGERPPTHTKDGRKIGTIYASALTSKKTTA